MKNAIISALQTKFPGVSDAICGRVADKLISSGKVRKMEEVETVVAGLTFQYLLEFWGDDRADQSQKSAVQNYEKKHNLKDGKPVEGSNGAKEHLGQQTGGSAKEDQTGGQQEQTPAWAQTLMDQYKTLNERLDGMQQERTASSRQSRLAEALKGASESVRSRYEKDFSRMTFKDDDDFDGWLSELTPDIEKMSVDSAPKGGIIGRPKTGGGGQKPQENPLLKERLAERSKAETQPPAIMGLATNS